MFASILSWLNKHFQLIKKILFTLSIVLLFRIGAYIIIPGVDYSVLHQCVSAIDNNNVGLSFINLFSGGAFLQLSIFALGITPYITSSIIMQLLGSVIPKLKELRTSGGSGYEKINQYTRYITVFLGILQGSSILIAFQNDPGRLIPGCDGYNIIPQSIGIFKTIFMILVITIGVVICMWFSELINDHGIGNGVSIFIFTSVTVQMPSIIKSIASTTKTGVMETFKLSILFIIIFLLIFAIVFIEESQRRIPLYGGRRIGKTANNNAYLYLPLKINQGGVIPIIFATSFLYFPYIIIQLMDPKGKHWLSSFFLLYFSRGDHIYYIIAYAVLILCFAFFYVHVIFNSDEISKMLNSNGLYIANIRVGTDTDNYIKRIANYLTYPGSLYLMVISIIPLVSLSFLTGNSAFILSGTSLLIMVTVALDFIRHIRASISDYNYYEVFKE